MLQPELILGAQARINVTVWQGPQLMALSGGEPWSERASSSRAAAQPKSAWPIDFCHDFQPIGVAERDQGQGIASAFGTPVHRGCSDSVVADYRRIPSGSRGGERAGAGLGVRL